MLGINFGKFSAHTWWIGNVYVRSSRVYTKKGKWTPFMLITFEIE